MADLSSEAGWRAFEQQHGGYLGAPSVTDPTIPVLDANGQPQKNPDGSPRTTPNPDPHYLYTFGDGTQVEINKAGDLGPLTKIATPGPQQGQTRKSLVKKDDGSTVAVTERADASGNWSVDTSVPPEPFLPASTPAVQPRTITVAGKGVMEEKPDGTWQLIAGSEPPKTPTAPTVSTTAQYIPEIGPDGQPTGKFTQNPNYRPQDTASAAAAQQGRQQAANSAQASQQAIDQYNAKVDADRKFWQDQVDQGYVMKPADLAALNAANARSLAELEASLKAAAEQAQWEREQPFKERAAALAEQQTAETGRHNLATEEGTRLSTATDVLGKQAAAEQGRIERLIKYGVAPSVETEQFAFQPYVTAMNMIRQGVRAGAIHPSQVPPPQAPVPQTAPQAPPPVQAPNAPLPAVPRMLMDIPPARYTAQMEAQAPAPTGGGIVQTPANRDMYWTE